MNNINKITEKLSNLSYKQAILIAFAVGFLVRLVPELLSFPNPIGWDTIYYASRMHSGVVFTVGSDLVNSWVIYGILASIANLTRLEPFLIIKIFVPLLYGGSAAAMFFVAWKKLDWSITKCLLVSILFSFQLSALAISWQFYRNMFGVMALLFALPLIKKDIGWKSGAALSVLALFTVWGHELAMVSLFFIVFGMLMVSKLKKEKIPIKLFLAILPAVLLFMSNFFWISPFAVPINTNLVRLDDSVWAQPGGLFFITDYLSVNTPIEAYTSYLDLLVEVGSLFVILYALLIPLIIVGFFKDRALSTWTFLLLFGGLGCLIIPFSALFLWARWMLMLVFPFTFFAANGLWKLTEGLKRANASRLPSWFKLTKKVGYGLALASMILGALFMTWPLIDGRYGLLSWSGSFKYVPSTMQTSSVPLQDINGVIKAYDWLNNNMDPNSTLLVHDTFDFWTMRYLDQSHKAFLFDFDLEAASDHAINEGYVSAYFVWWNQDIGRYDLELSNDWISIQDYGRISIYHSRNM